MAANALKRTLAKNAASAMAVLARESMISCRELGDAMLRAENAMRHIAKPYRAFDTGSLKSSLSVTAGTCTSGNIIIGTAEDNLTRMKYGPTVLVGPRQSPARTWLDDRVDEVRRMGALR